MRWRGGSFRLRLDYGRGRLLQLRRRRFFFLREVEALFAPPLPVQCFERGRLSLAPPSSYSFRRVEATTALRCQLETRGDFGC